MMTEKDRHIFGTVKVGEKGQIVIPKEARTLYNINPGDSLLLLGDDTGIAIIRPNTFRKMLDGIFSEAMGDAEENEK